MYNKEYETKFAENIVQRNLSTPDGLKLMSELATGLAFDNYDELTETLDGCNTLHDTVVLHIKMFVMILAEKLN